MHLTVIGSGTCIIRPDRFAASYLLEANKQFLLFDCGWGSGINLVRAGYKLEKLDHIFVTHPHADHLGNLMNILQSIFVTGLYYPNRKRTKTLFLHGYRGFRDNYEQLRKIMFPERIEPFETKIYEYDNNSREQDDFIIQARPMAHGQGYFNAVAYRLQYHDRAFIYSGDTGFTEELIKLAFNADLAVFEMGVSIEEYQKDGPRPNHLAPYECGLIAAQAGVKKLILSHLNDLTEESAATKEVRKNFSGELIFATDLKKISV